VDTPVHSSSLLYVCIGNRIHTIRNKSKVRRSNSYPQHRGCSMHTPSVIHRAIYNKNDILIKYQGLFPNLLFFYIMFYIFFPKTITTPLESARMSFLWQIARCIKKTLATKDLFQ